MMRAGRDYLTKGIAARREPRDRLVKRSAAPAPGPKDASPPKRKPARKPGR